MLLVFFFFFQAEDGIRDATVTGVQTCALPISHPQALRSLPHHALLNGVAARIRSNSHAGGRLMHYFSWSVSCRLTAADLVLNGRSQLRVVDTPRAAYRAPVKANPTAVAAANVLPFITTSSLTLLMARNAPRRIDLNQT